MSKTAVALAVAAACMVGLMQPTAAYAQRNPGVSTVCGEFLVIVPPIVVPIPLIFSMPDEGWAYVNPARKRRQATGIAFEVQTASTDTPANHYSHDLDFKILLDPDQEDILSVANGEGLPVEWETGIRPEEKDGDGANPIFPKWVWPGQNDRVWVDGNWIFDCGHPDEDTGLYQAELHPARAVATMRERAATLIGSGLTPVPVTLTDLYISGNGGYAPNQLNCGPQIILGDHGDTCGEETPPADESYKTTPINDTNFTFSVCLPPRPTANAVLTHDVAFGPGDTLPNIAPQIQRVPSEKFCIDPGYDAGTMLRVTIPLQGTATAPTEVYARKIYAGWLAPPDPVLPHRQLTLNKTDLHEDHDGDPGDGELTFWWMNVNLAEYGWLRLSDFANGNMNDYDDDGGVFGDGEMGFTGATVDYYMRHGQDLTVESQGYEQDCFDNAFSPLPDGYWFTLRELHLSMYATCYADLFDKGAGDRLGRTRVSLGADDLGPRKIQDSDQYDLYVTIDEVPIKLEDESHLSIVTACTPTGEVALVGQPLPCETLVHNGGTGLPRRVEVSNQFSGTPAPTIGSSKWAIPGPLGTPATDCVIGATAVCKPTTVLVAFNTPVIMTTNAVPTAAGLLTERAEVKTASTDPNLSNNVATTTVDVYRPIALDVSPRNAINEINLGRGGTVSVAIISTGGFDATTVDPSTLCFGDSDAPGERACAEQHGQGHIEDVNRDRVPDLLLHFSVAATGIDLNDTSACVIGRTFDGVGIYGCDVITTRPQ